MDVQAIIKDMEDILVGASRLSMDMLGKAKSQIKGDTSIVTEADLAVTRLIKDRLNPYLRMDGHTLIDEESLESLGKPSDVFAQSMYQWVLDPIDGTVAYAHGADTFGILLALLKNGHPFLAGVAMPAKGLMWLADETSVTQIHHGQRTVLPPTRLVPHGPQAYCNISGLRFEASLLHQQHKVWAVSGNSAVQELMTTALGHASGSAGRKNGMSIWDLAAPATIGMRLGIDYQWLQDGQPIFPCGGTSFQDNWKMNHDWVASHPETIQLLRGMLNEAKTEIARTHS